MPDFRWTSLIAANQCIATENRQQLYFVTYADPQTSSELPSSGLPVDCFGLTEIRTCKVICPSLIAQWHARHAFPLDREFGETEEFPRLPLRLEIVQSS